MGGDMIKYFKNQNIEYFLQIEMDNSYLYNLNTGKKSKLTSYQLRSLTMFFNPL